MTTMNTMVKHFNANYGSRNLVTIIKEKNKKNSNGMLLRVTKYNKFIIGVKPQINISLNLDQFSQDIGK